MKVSNEYSIILVNDWGCSNYTTHYSPIAIVEIASENVIKEILTKYFLEEMSYDENDINELLNECVPILATDNKYVSDEFEIAIKIESAKFYKHL